jgi:hypothetical protein
MCPFDPNLRTGALITRRAAESEMLRLEVMCSKSSKDSRLYDEPKRILVGKGFELDAIDHLERNHFETSLAEHNFIAEHGTDALHDAVMSRYSHRVMSAEQALEFALVETVEDVEASDELDRPSAEEIERENKAMKETTDEQKTRFERVATRVLRTDSSDEESEDEAAELKASRVDRYRLLVDSIDEGKTWFADKDLLERAETRLKHINGLQDLRATYGRLSVFTENMRFDLDPTVIEQYCTYLKDAIAIATKAENDAHLIMDASNLLMEIQARYELSLAIHSKTVEVIEKAIAFGSRQGLPEKVLENAEAKRIEIAAIEAVDLASLQEQRNEGTSLKSIIMVFNETMVDRLRAAVEAAIAVPVEPKQLHHAKEVLRTVELRMGVEAAIRGTDIRNLRQLLARAMNADFPAELINKANQRRMSLELIENAEEALKTEDIKIIDEVIHQSKFKMPGMLVIAYAIDMNQWFSDLIAKRNAISSRQELERHSEQYI